MEPRDIAYAGLGYVGIDAVDPVAWRDFATQVCGLMPANGFPGARKGGAVSIDIEAGGIAPDGTAFLKMDDHQWRLAVHPSKQPGLRYFGLELRDVPEVARASECIAARGADIRAGSDDERAARGVEALSVLSDSAGHRVELFAGPIRDRGFLSPSGAEFKTGGLGVGHIVLYVPDVESALVFYRETLGFERSDYMTFGPGGMGIHFLRCTKRHHSVALLQVGDIAGVQHLMFENTSLDDVGRALDRALSREIPITSFLGRHRNDQTVSFYMQGPSGFDVEIGWDGLIIGDDWVENEFAGGGDEWGHHGLDAAALQPKV
ncbi:MAG: VOC family protein [Myxococcales bacterium]|nr:VOC family protein [Myxococcales bacterium]